MTGVAARTLGTDVILNELSPAASFITDRFTRSCDRLLLLGCEDHMRRIERCSTGFVYDTLSDVRARDRNSFHGMVLRVRCSTCEHDSCFGITGRHYEARSVSTNLGVSHAIMQCCAKEIAPGTDNSEPVLIGYKCCTRQQVEHPLTMRTRAD